MPNHNYRRGAYYERLARAQLQGDGYQVMRSAGSKGAWDLIAWLPQIDGGMRFIQCKAQKATAAEVKAFRAECLRLPLGATGELWARSHKEGWVKQTVDLLNGSLLMRPALEAAADTGAE